MRLLAKKTIRGCESDGTADSPYLTRWTILGGKQFAVYLHKFHRSDRDDLHDHPWPFITIILWRGYIDVSDVVCGPGECGRDRLFRSRKRMRPGMVAFRKATHRHKVELINGRSAWSLVIRGSYVRDWGFFTHEGWQRWKEYFLERGC